MLLFLHKLFTNKSRDLFVVRLGVTLLLGKFGIVGALAGIVAPVFYGFLGLLIDAGIYRIDLLLDSIREGMKLKEFEKAAKAAYDHATAKVYNEAEKAKIRKQYLDIVSRIGTVGNGPK